MRDTLWTDKQIKKWAKQYIGTKKMTLYKLEELIAVSHSTLWWCFRHRLESIDADLYGDVMVKLATNKRKGGRRCRMAK